MLVVGLLGFALVGLGFAVALDVGDAGTKYLAVVDRAANAPGSIVPRRLRGLAATRSPRLRLLAAAGLVGVGAAWVLIATHW